MMAGRISSRCVPQAVASGAEKRASRSAIPLNSIVEQMASKRDCIQSGIWFIFKTLEVLAPCPGFPPSSANYLFERLHCLVVRSRRPKVNIVRSKKIVARLTVYPIGSKFLNLFIARVLGMLVEVMIIGWANGLTLPPRS